MRGVPVQGARAGRALADCQHVCVCFFFNTNNFYLFIFLFIFGRAGFSLWCGLFCNCGKQGLLSIAVHGFLIAVASLVAELRL